MPVQRSFRDLPPVKRKSKTQKRVHQSSDESVDDEYFPPGTYRRNQEELSKF